MVAGEEHQDLRKRVRAQNENALQMAQFLDQHPLQRPFIIQALKPSRSYTSIEKQMNGFRRNVILNSSRDNTLRFCDHLEMIKPAMSLAGVRVL